MQIFYLGTKPILVTGLLSFIHDVFRLHETNGYGSRWISPGAGGPAGRFDVTISAVTVDFDAIAFELAAVEVDDFDVGAEDAAWLVEAFGETAAVASPKPRRR